MSDDIIPTIRIISVPRDANHVKVLLQCLPGFDAGRKVVVVLDCQLTGRRANMFAQRTSPTWKLHGQDENQRQL
jgi:hypothetical protein